MIKKIQLGIIPFLLIGCVSTSDNSKKIDLEQLSHNYVSKYKHNERNAYLELSPTKFKKRSFEFSIDGIDTKEITAAFLKVPIKKKTVIARWIGDSDLTSTCAIVLKTPFYLSRSAVNNSLGAPCIEATKEFDTSMMSVLERTGGTGGKATYSTQGDSLDVWDVTHMVNQSIKERKQFTFKLGHPKAGNISLTDRTIFSDSVILNKYLFSSEKAKLIIFK